MLHLGEVEMINRNRSGGKGGQKNFGVVRKLTIKRVPSYIQDLRVNTLVWIGCTGNVYPIDTININETIKKLFWEDNKTKDNNYILS